MWPEEGNTKDVARPEKGNLSDMARRGKYE